MEHRPKFSDGTLVPFDGQFHTDPADPKTSIRCLELYTPPGVLEILAGGNTARVGLLADGTVLKYPLDPKDRHLVQALAIEDAILTSLGSHERLVTYLGKTDHGLRFERAYHGNSADCISRNSASSSVHQFGAKWSLQAAEAVDFIHGKGVIHCDIHPNNFLVDENYNLRICDFSGSVFGELDGGAMESTRYFLPRSPLCPPSIHSDLFALGSAVYFFMATHDPYHTLPEDEVSARYSRGEFPDVAGIAVGQVILGCWKAQYSNAYNVWRDLESLLSMGH